MTRRFTTAAPTMFLAALAGCLLLFSDTVRSTDGDKPEAPKNVRTLGDASPAQSSSAWTRVIVELNVPDRERPDGSLRNRVAVLAQAQVYAARRAKVLAALPPDSYRVMREYQTMPYVALLVNGAGMASLRANERDVRRVMPDEVSRPELADSGPLVQADQAWAAGFDGSGFDVAILDTGVDASHPFLAGKVAAEACFSNTVAGSSQSLCPNGLAVQHGAGSAAPCPFGDCYHGTHVAGVAAGDGVRARQPFSGIARGADVIAVQVFSQLTDASVCGGASPCVGAFTSDVLAALEDVYLLTWDRHIAAVNLSLGVGTFPACDDQPYAGIIATLKNAGVATVVASGNGASTSMVAAPACAPAAVSVGSSSKADVLSWFSNVSPSLSLLAPGESVTSSITGGAYGAVSGTSAAAAHVAGAWAVARQAAPHADVDTILNVFRQTGLPITDGRAGAHTTVPRLRLFQALTKLTTIPNPAPSITSIDPVGARAGDPAMTLTVDGSGFDAFSVVKWNGSARPTTVVSTTRLTTAISAPDLAAVGTALVSVFNPAPGGGTSATAPFAIDPSATLTPNATRVGPGAEVTVTLANGFGGAGDWMALAVNGAPDNNYLQATNVGGGVTNRTWTVTMPTSAGAYEFRLFVNNAKKATSKTVTVDLALTPVPVAASIAPDSAQAGSGALLLTVNGARFMPWSVVQWNGTDRPTTFVDSGQLQAAIGASDVAAAGTAAVRVSTPAPAPGGGASSPLTFTVNNPAPSVATVLPATVLAGSGAFTVTVNGGGFVATSVVKWNGAERPTTFVNSTQLLAAIPAADVSAAGPAQIAVNSPAPGGGTSNGVVITIANPLPSVSSLSPANVTIGSTAFVLTVNGSGFVPTSVVRWNGAPRATTYVGPSQLSAAIAAADVASAGTAQVTVESPAPGGGVSTGVLFTTMNPAPAATAISPSGTTAGAAAFTLTVSGSGFVPTSVVRWNGAPRTTTFVGATQLTAAIQAADVVAPGSAQVTVATPAPGGGTSSPVTFSIVAPVPTLTVPSTSVLGGSSVTVTLTGGLGGSADWIALAESAAPNTSYLQYTYVGAGVTTTTWTVNMPATGGPYEFRLFLNNGYTRAATSAQITVVPPPPVITTVSPSAAIAGSSSVNLVVNGANFTPSSIVRWNGANRTTAYFGPTQLAATIPASDLAVPGTAQVTVFAPAPGGGTSNAATFTIGAPPTLTVSATTVATGGALTVTLTGGLGGPTDWIAFAPNTAVDTTYLTWVYVGAGVTTRTWTITAPAPGKYEFRLFLNNGFTRAATSPVVTVQ